MKEIIILLIVTCFLSLMVGLFAKNYKVIIWSERVALVTGLIFLFLLMFVYDPREEYRNETETIITD